MKIQIFDSEGTEVKIGDLVLVQDKRTNGLTFYTKIQIVDGNIYPFNKFTYDRVVKINSIPDGCTYSPATGRLPEYWIKHNVKLHLIENNQFEKWRVDALTFERSPFYKISE